MDQMDDFQVCSSLIFKLTNESAIYDVLEEIALAYDVFFVYFLLYAGPVLVLANFFAIFILTRKDLRTPYNIIFLMMVIDQSLSILGRTVLIWKSYFNFGCGFAFTLPYQIFEMILVNLCPVCTAHATWLAVIITFVRLRHIGSSSKENRWTIVNSTQTLEIVPFIFDSYRLYDNDCLLLRITYISSGVLYNALPSTSLIVLSAALAYRLRKIRKIHADTMMGRSSAVNAESVRSSWMIAMIVFTTLITDVPQAIVNILVGFMSERFRNTVAFKLSSLIVTLVIFSSAVNLTIYLCMSRRIREVEKD